MLVASFAPRSRIFAAVRPLRVLHLIETLGLGGAEVMLSQTLPVLARRGAEVRVLTVCLPDTLAGSLRARGVPVRTVTPRAVHADVAPRFRFLPALVGELVRSPVDIVHSHLFHPTLVARLVSVLSARRGPKLVTSLHNPDYSNMEEVARWKAGLRRAFDWSTAIASTDAFVAVSEGVRRDFEMHMGGAGVWGRIEMIPNSIDADAVAEAVGKVDRRAARSELGVEPGEFVIVAIGRLIFQKNFDILIGVVAGLRARGVPARVFVFGDGPDRARLSAASGPFVSFRGAVDRAAILRALAACDAYAQPSRWEAFGIAALEAMAASRPVVACAVPGLDEVVADGETGLLVPRGDVVAMTEAFARIVGDAPSAARWAAAGSERAKSRFGLASWAEQTFSLYERLLARRR